MRLRRRRPGAGRSSPALRGRVVWLAGLVACLAGLTPGRADPLPTADSLPAPPAVGLDTGAQHEVVLPPAQGQGLEQGMPRSGPYARGIQLDRQGRWAESQEAFNTACAAFLQQLQRSSPRARAQVQGWADKADYMADLSRTLRLHPGGSTSSSPYTLLSHAAARHEKWLAARAFLGHEDPQEAAQLVALYGQVLVRSQLRLRARVLLAALHHELGQPALGRKTFALLRSPDDLRYDYDLSLALAYYYTLTGDRARALSHLQRAARHSRARRVAWRSNLFDGLRSDPQFRTLMRLK